jgi:hypothetical protein
LRGDVFGKLLNDVFGLRGGKAGFNGLEIAIDHLHDSSLYSKHAQDHEAQLTKFQGDLAEKTTRLRDGVQECGRPDAHGESGKHEQWQEFRSIVLKA